MSKAKVLSQKTTSARGVGVLALLCGNLIKAALNIISAFTS